MDFLGKIHPVIIHFPVALFTVYTLFEIISLYMKEKNFERVSLIILGLGILFSVWAVMTGDKAFETVRNLLSEEQLKLVESHENYATITMFYYAGLLFIKFFLLTKNKMGGLVKYIYLAMVFIGNIFIYLTGYYGGQLVFEYGIGTAIFK